MRKILIASAAFLSLALPALAQERDLEVLSNQSLYTAVPAHAAAGALSGAGSTKPVVAPRGVESSGAGIGGSTSPLVGAAPANRPSSNAPCHYCSALDIKQDR